MSDILMVKKKTTKKQVKDWKKIIDGGLLKYIFSYGLTMGCMFGGIMLLIDYIILQDAGSIGEYVFLIIFFGLGMSLWSWYVMKKRIKEYG